MPTADTATILTAGDGDKRRTFTVPTTVLSDLDGLILCAYRDFLDRHELQEGIFCRECWQGRGEAAKIARAQNQVAIVCPHHVWFYQGVLPAMVQPTDGLVQLADAPKAHQRIELTDVDCVVPLSGDEAKLLRAYRAFLLKNSLLETLDCRTCWSSGDPSGCRAFVTPDRIAVICRHRTLQFVGQTV